MSNEELEAIAKAGAKAHAQSIWAEGVCFCWDDRECRLLTEYFKEVWYQGGN